MNQNKPYNRLDRVNKQVLDILSGILHKNIDLTYLGFVTFTKVDVSRDLRIAKVFYSVINQSMSKQGVRFELGNSVQKRQIMQGVYTQASDIWRNIEDSNLYLEKPSRGVLVYPVSANNLVKGESLRDVNFLVSENKLLILKGKEIARAVLDSRLSAEELLGQMFEMDEQLKKQMFDQGILGNRFKPRAPGQIMRFAQVVSSIKNEKDRQFISVIADADIYSGGGFAFRYDIKKEVDYLKFIEQRKLEDKSPQQRLRDRLKKFKRKFQTSISESNELTMP